MLPRQATDPPGNLDSALHFALGARPWFCTAREGRDVARELDRTCLERAREGWRRWAGRRPALKFTLGSESPGPMGGSECEGACGQGERLPGNLETELAEDSEPRGRWAAGAVWRAVTFSASCSCRLWVSRVFENYSWECS